MEIGKKILAAILCLLLILTYSCAAPAPRKGTRAEEAYWGTIKNSTHMADFAGYLSEYPRGKYSKVARLKIKQLKRAMPVADDSLPAEKPFAKKAAKPEEQPTPKPVAEKNVHTSAKPAEKAPVYQKVNEPKKEYPPECYSTKGIGGDISGVVWGTIAPPLAMALAGPKYLATGIAGGLVLGGVMALLKFTRYPKNICD